MVQYNKYQLKNGQTRWKYKGYWGINPKTGVAIEPKKQGFKTRSEAKIHYEREINRLNESFGEKAANKITYKQLYEEFLEYYRNTGVTGGTIKKYKEETKMHIFPILEDYYIDQIDIDDCQQLVKFVMGRRKDYRKIIGHARSAFNYAVEKGYIKENPISKVKIPRSKVKYKQRRVAPKDNVYNPEELMKFLDFILEKEPYYVFVYFRLLAFGGLRRGEALALHKSDMNDDNYSVMISKTLAESESGKTILSHFSKTSYHDDEPYELYLDNFTYQSLENLVKQSYAKDKYGREIDISNSPYLFTSPLTNTHYHRQAPNDWLKRIWQRHGKELEEMGLKYISPHGFRHSQATLLYELGVNPKDAQHRLRHKTIKTTLDIYTHISNDREKETANKLNNLILLDTSKNTSKISNDS